MKEMEKMEKMEKMMKAMIFKGNQEISENNFLELSMIPVPEVKSDEILIKVYACGVCRTELDQIEGRIIAPKLPIVLGHQPVGVVEQIGNKVRKFKIGDIAGATWIYSSCGKCKFCLRGYDNLCLDFKATGCHENGGYAEYMVIKEDYAHKIPEELIDFEPITSITANTNNITKIDTISTTKITTNNININTNTTTTTAASTAAATTAATTTTTNNNNNNNKYINQIKHNKNNPNIDNIGNIDNLLYVAPLMCSGVVGYRSLKLTNMEDEKTLGLYGFGSAHHLVLQIANFLYPNSKKFVFTRNLEERELAKKLGADWAGGIEDKAPEKLDCIIDTTPVWKTIIYALENLQRGGRLVLNLIRKENSDKNFLLNLNYEKHLWLEKEIKSTANVTKKDGEEFLAIASKMKIKPQIKVYKLEDANEALTDLKHGKFPGSKVLKI